MKLLFSIALVLILNNETEKNKVIKPGVGIDNLMLDKSTIHNAISKLGSNDNFCQGIACGSNGSYYTNRYEFSKYKLIVSSITKEGSKENLNKEISKIQQIVAYYPSELSTVEGIKINTDNYTKVIAVYGKPEKETVYKDRIEINYFTKGISFRFNSKDASIQSLVVYKKGGTPEFTSCK